MIYLVRIEKKYCQLLPMESDEVKTTNVVERCFDLVEGFYHEDDAKRYRAEKCSRDEKFILLEGKLI